MKTIQNATDLEENMAQFNISQYHIAKCLKKEIKKIGCWLSIRQIPQSDLQLLSIFFSEIKLKFQDLQDSKKFNFQDIAKIRYRLKNGELTISELIIKGNEDYQKIL
jgi:hypothetical protein